MEMKLIQSVKKDESSISKSTLSTLFKLVFIRMGKNLHYKSVGRDGFLKHSGITIINLTISLNCC